MEADSRISPAADRLSERGFVAGVCTSFVCVRWRHGSAHSTRTRLVRGVNLEISAKRCPLSDPEPFRGLFSPHYKQHVRFFLYAVILLSQFSSDVLESFL